jgi:EpsI family protein
MKPIACTINPRPTDLSRFNQVFGLVFESEVMTEQDQIKERPLSKPLIACLGMVAATALIISVVGGREEIKPEREFLSSFPRSIGEWNGQPSTLEAGVLKTLDLTDYLLADYTERSAVPVNIYVAYYESQRKGSSPHSPTVCLPGSGWQITGLTRQDYKVTEKAGSFEYNRVIISKGNYRQLVYYWFEERGQVMADEYAVKWQLFVDAIFMNRTDGALVRITTPIVIEETEEEADRRMVNFMAGVVPLLPEYVPK